MSLLAIDIGSSASKAVLFTGRGGTLAEHNVSYAPEFPRPCFAEMNAEKFWRAICAACHAVTKSASEPVHALCLSSHGETFVAVDAHGRALGPAILNQDSRATAEANLCVQEIGRKRLFEITGLVAHPMYPVPKMLWLRKHEASLFASTTRFVTLIGYLLLRMGLAPYVDYSLASRFLAFDIRKRCWSQEILSMAGLDSDRLPEPVPAGTVAGKLNAEGAGSLGLAPGTMVVVGGHDQPCGAVGVGVISAGRVADSMGTYECLLACSDAPCLSDAALTASLNSYCHVVPDKFVTLAYFPSGIMVKWFHDLLYAHGSDEASAEDSNPQAEARHYSLLESERAQAPTGICITPHLIGTCNPEFNPHARAAIVGLSAGTRRGQIYRGILEGLACELAVLTEVLAEAVGNFCDIYAYGGGTRSALGLRLRAAVTRKRFHMMTRQESVCLGTAILAAVATGEYKDVSEAVASMVQEASVQEPDAAVGDSYREQLKRYRILRSIITSQVWM
jgi:xylulokinase